MRPAGRSANQVRPVTLTRNYTKHAEGSVLVEFGDTKVLCTASIDEGVPRFLKGQGQGWITAEYGMLPRSTHTRNAREAAKGKQGGRTMEIQRLIARALRAAVDLKALGEFTITLDCDVLQADGGTRTASVTGGFVALALVMVFTGSPIHITVFEALYPLVTLFFFSLGVGLFLAAATVFFRDIMHIWSVFITALLYFSAIFYDPTQMTFSIGGFNMQQIIKLNPMYWYITGFRRTLMWGIPLDINMFLVCGLCAVVSMLVGVQMFRKTQDRFVLHI